MSSPCYRYAGLNQRACALSLSSCFYMLITSPHAMLTMYFLTVQVRDTLKEKLVEI